MICSLRFLMAVLLCLSVKFAAAVEVRKPARPNIVFIMADDMGQGDLGCYNAESKIPTPNMDRLASQGMRFTDAHTPSSVCTPTRYGVLTGRYSWRTRLKSGVLWGYSKLLIEEDRMTVASMLKQHGYQTGAVGKWHLGFQAFDPAKTEKGQQVDYSKPLRPGPATVGFDYFYGIPASLDMDPYLWIENDRAVQLPTVHDPGSKRVWDGGGGFWRAGPRAPDFKFDQVLPTIGNKASAFIDRTAKSSPDKPFFLYVPLASPHTPWVPTKDFHGASKAGKYGDFTNQCDAVVGQIVAALQRNKLTANTLIIVTSDNGSHWPANRIEKYNHQANNHRRGMKADIWEGGHRVPFIARWPGMIAPGSISRQTICLTDLTATAAEIVGQRLPDGAAEDSFSILPALTGHDLMGDGGRQPIRDAVIHHSVGGTFAIRMGDWKLIDGNLGSGGFTAPRKVAPKAGGPQGQLYNLADDPQEKNNLYQKHPQVVARLKAKLKQIKTSGHSRPIPKAS